MDEKIDLKWKSFPDHQIQTPAHKLVLSACSPVLKSLLVNNPHHPHPLLYLRGIKQSELKAILKFMYFGEVRIYENRITDFANVANDLQVNDMNQEEEEEVTKQNIEEANSKENLIEDEDHANTGRDVLGELPEKVFTIDKTLATSDQGRIVISEEKKYKCNQCDAAYHKSYRLTRHRESKHEGKIFKCDECDAIYNDKASLRNHHQAKHLGIQKRRI